LLTTRRGRGALFNRQIGPTFFFDLTREHCNDDGWRELEVSVRRDELANAQCVPEVWCSSWWQWWWGTSDETG
jgi:hypothetical protein